MLNFLYNYGLFFAKTITILLSFIIAIASAAAIASKNKKDKFKIKNLNHRYKEIQNTVYHEILTKKELKQHTKEKKKQPTSTTPKKRIFVLEFKGDIKASAVKELREEITAILEVASPATDEVALILESSGGMFPHYGLASSQLQRIRQRGIHLTVLIDKMAASGGYMMACVANQIYAAPFAIIGSIGVVAQSPNFYNWLKKHNIDFEQFTGGEYKRTLSLFAKNTEKGLEKFKEEVIDAYELFKSFVAQNRNILEINEVATGEIWYGDKALQLKLIDKIITSDDYLLAAAKEASLYEIKYCTAKKLEKIFSLIGSYFNNLLGFRSIP